MTGRGMDGSVVSTIQQGFPTTALAMMKFVNMSHVWHQLSHVKSMQSLVVLIVDLVTHDDMSPWKVKVVTWWKTAEDRGSVSIMEHLQETTYCESNGNMKITVITWLKGWVSGRNICDLISWQQYKLQQWDNTAFHRMYSLLLLISSVILTSLDKY